MSNKPGGWQGAVFAPCFIRDQGLLCLAQRTEETMKKGCTHNKAVLKKYFPVYLMAFPGLLYLFINNYMPLPGLVLAFKKYNAKKGIWGSSWVGLKNFKFLFATNDAFIITRNTLFYNIVFIIVNTVAAIAVAIILAEMRHKIKKFYQSAILLPYMLSMVIVSYLVFAFLSTENGFINLDFMGNLGHSIVKNKGDRVYIEKGNKQKLSDVDYFTFEPHISIPRSKYGYKKENIYYFEDSKLVEL